MTAKEKDKLEAIAELRKIIKPGQEIRTLLRHVSRSGMYRAIDLYTMGGGELRRITWTAARALQDRYDRKHEAIGVGVYNLGSVLYPKGFTCTGKNCPSSDHSNGDRNYRRHHHNDGGYALRQRWI